MSVRVEDVSRAGTTDRPLVVAGVAYRSRLLVGTGKYKDFEETARAIEISGADVMTVAVRRVNITDRKSENLLDHVDPLPPLAAHGGRVNALIQQS